MCVCVIKYIYIYIYLYIYTYIDLYGQAATNYSDSGCTACRCWAFRVSEAQVQNCGVSVSRLSGLARFRSLRF